MSAISVPFSFSPNTTILSSQVNSDLTTIYNDYNGNIGDANVISLSEGKIVFTSTGHDHSGGTKGALVAMTVVQGRLTFVSSTQIKFERAGVGARYYLKKSGVWTALTISAAITAANTSIFLNGTGGQNLAASTTYYVYLFDNAGTTTIDFSATGSVIDATTGLAIKNGDDTRLLVGMVRTNGSSQFQFDNALRGVLSYHARRAISCEGNFSTDRSTASTTVVELNSEIQTAFLTWTDEIVLLHLNGAGFNTTAGAERQTGIGVDSTSTVTAATASASGNASDRMDNSVMWAGFLSEGYHFITLLGSVGSGTGTWIAADAAGVNAAGANRLQAITRG